MVGLRTLSDHIVPTITAAASKAGRPDPQVVVSLPVCVTADPDGAQARAARTFAIYNQLPSYRAMLDREGASGPPDVAIVGTEEEVSASIGRLADAGATTFDAVAYGTPEELTRTQALLGTLA
jgi:alkanesulfonate monooxygenase SsuD/methylene tetrahydromethanopterin reductase-like flavin-dependent oxidoreductase (luciferase family)